MKRPNWLVLTLAVLLTFAVVAELGKPPKEIVVDAISWTIIVLVVAIGIGLYLWGYRRRQNRPLSNDEREMVNVQLFGGLSRIATSAAGYFRSGNEGSLASLREELFNTLRKIQDQRVNVEIQQLIGNACTEIAAKQRVSPVVNWCNSTWVVTFHNDQTGETIVMTENEWTSVKS